MVDICLLFSCFDSKCSLSLSRYASHQGSLALFHRQDVSPPLNTMQNAPETVVDIADWIILKAYNEFSWTSTAIKHCDRAITSRSLSSQDVLDNWETWIAL